MHKVTRRIPLVTALALCLFAFLGASAAAAEKERYIVVLKDSVDAPGDVAREHAGRFAGDVGFVYRHALKGYSAKLPAPAVAALERDPRVRFVARDHRMEIAAQDVPTGIRRTFATSNGYIDIDGVDDLRVDADVAVIDSGIDFDHPDLNVVGRTSCMGGVSVPCADGTGDDGHGHGTHVAGTVGAIDNGVGVVGIAPGARLWGVKVLSDSGLDFESSTVAGVDWVTAHASEIEVANMSIRCDDIPARCSPSALAVAISGSVDAGVVYAVAAGNFDRDAMSQSPANHPDVITVSALADFDGLPGGAGSPTCRPDQDDTLADFSNWGAAVEVAAPGVCILSTWKNGGYNTISGTSMASPHVAGAAAVLASRSNPDSRSDVMAIRQEIIDEGNLNWIDDSGDGVQEPLLDLTRLGVAVPENVDLASSQTGRLDLVATASDGTLRYRSRTNGVWSAWQDLGGTAIGRPVLLSSEPGRLDLFIRGDDSAVHHRAYVEGSGWAAWQSLGGTTNANVDAVSWGPGRLDVVMRGTDNALWHKWKQSPGPWSPNWDYHGGYLTSEPSITSKGPNDLHIFVRGGGNGLHVKSWTGFWSDWAALGGTITSAPEAITTRNASGSFHHLVAFARGTDNNVWDREGDGSGFFWDWQLHGGAPVTSHIAATSRGFRWVDVYTHTGNSSIQVKRLIFHSGSTWQDLGGDFQEAAPRVASTTPLSQSQPTDIAALGTDRKIYVGTYTSTGFQGWQALNWHE